MIILPENIYVILFDGDCLLCHACVQKIIQNDTSKKFYFAALNSEFGDQIRSQLSIYEQDYNSIILYLPNYTYHIKAQAVAEIAKHLKAPYSWLRFTRLLPNSIANWIYDYVARNRYQWFGKSNSCYLPKEDERHRFLD
ncbi:DCC1-like thiol-disulfide oxidoreductase family protein [Flavobacterium sp.]|jgi:predicted DCC family thiol-disulfide oxidoreductase YuxK|uniref:thiol-disulfide oxidoreductase DCC family protein n=1 Tax=Flavobacterium sp. TaxID=239 RepID=UPI002608BFDB|nr:DCC1-like thiol-disulfide oxidoreductase family protein [Flavobacterium sp.]